jgi:hypothetical protein
MEVIPMEERSSPAADGDWRDEFECETCRAWTGKPPLALAIVEASFRERFPGVPFRVSHACHLRTDGEGNRHHIPTTVIEIGGRIEEGGSYHQWIPELPDGASP